MNLIQSEMLLKAVEEYGRLSFLLGQKMTKKNKEGWQDIWIKMSKIYDKIQSYVDCEMDMSNE